MRLQSYAKLSKDTAENCQEFKRGNTTVTWRRAICKIKVRPWSHWYYGAPAKYQMSDDAYNHGGGLILKDIWNERVAKGVNSNPHDFTTDPLPF